MYKKQPFNKYKNNNFRRNNRPQNNNTSPQQPRPEKAIRREVTLQSLLECGAHFGSSTSTWHPKTAPFIFGARRGKAGKFSESVYIIDLEQTLSFWERARTELVKHIEAGGTALIVGTKLSTQKLLKEEAEANGIAFVNSRWLGGTLTNFGIIKRSLSKLDKLEKLLAKTDTGEIVLTKKEILSMRRSAEKLIDTLGGLRVLKGLPSLIIVLDAKKDHIVLQEAKRLRIPVMALVDTDVNPDTVDIPIPANDDSNGSQALFIRAFVDAIKEGNLLKQQRVESEAASTVVTQQLKENPPENLVKPEQVVPVSEIPVFKKKNKSRTNVVPQSARS